MPLNTITRSCGIAAASCSINGIPLPPCKDRSIADAAIDRSTVFVARPVTSGHGMASSLSSLTFEHEGQSATIERFEEGDRVIAVRRTGATTAVVGDTPLVLSRLMDPDVLGVPRVLPPVPGAAESAIFDAMRAGAEIAARPPVYRPPAVSREVYDELKRRGLVHEPRARRPSKPERRLARRNGKR